MITITSGKQASNPSLILLPTPPHRFSPPLPPLSSIWKWRNQYTDVLGGLGTGIGEGDRGVICGRETECCAAREREQETDGDAEDAREAEIFQQQHQHQQAMGPATPSSSSSMSSNASSTNASSSLTPWSTTSAAATAAGANGSPNSSTAALDRRTPSPALKPGYERHEIEGIGGVMKKKLVRMVKVGACVPEWDDERVKGEILGREVQGQRRSWCGWCWRVIPSKRDYELDRRREESGKEEEELKGK